VNSMCRVLGVKRNNFYSFQKRQHSKTPDESEREELLFWIKNIAKFSDNTYGARRMKKVLNALSFKISRRKTQQLMEEAGVWVRYKKKYKVTTNSDHKKPTFKNELGQNFNVAQPNQAWGQDVSYGVPGVQGEHGMIK